MLFFCFIVILSAINDDDDDDDMRICQINANCRLPSSHTMLITCVVLWTKNRVCDSLFAVATPRVCNMVVLPTLLCIWWIYCVVGDVGRRCFMRLLRHNVFDQGFGAW